MEERGKEGGEGEGRLTLMRSWNRAADWLRSDEATDYTEPTLANWRPCSKFAIKLTLKIPPHLKH